MLLATLLMTVILAALATVTAQWLPNWNRGMARVQRAERLAMGLDRDRGGPVGRGDDPGQRRCQGAAVRGIRIVVTFVRTAVGPNTRPGLEIIGLIEKADSQGLAMVRERAPFVPMPSDAQIRFADQVVLIRAPFRVTFSYAGPDQVWQPNWRDQMQLPDMIRVTVRDGATGQVLAVSQRRHRPRQCAGGMRAGQECGELCLTARLKPDADKKEEQL